MHWVIQQSIFKPGNFQLLVTALERFGIGYSTVSIPNGTFAPVPDVVVDGKVYVCGAIKLANIARERGWSPGSFLNENFSFDLWIDKLGSDLLNADVTMGTLATVQIDRSAKFFIRPLEDNKAFDGAVIDAEMLDAWRVDPARERFLGMAVMVSPVKPIYREYRLFIVNNEFVTGSVYRVGGRAEVSPDIEEYVLDFARSVIHRWTPAESCVMDIALTDSGLKVIEFNNINSSGFYASDVAKYVDAIQTCYAEQ